MVMGTCECSPRLVVLLEVPVVLERTEVVLPERPAEGTRALRREALERAHREQVEHVCVSQARAGRGLLQPLRNRWRKYREPLVHMCST